jgi:hypothetical protein
MSYLELPNGIPDFDKAVISFWFRAPQESLNAVADKAWDEAQKLEASREESLDGYGTYVVPRMTGFLPLITFGPLFEGAKFKPETLGTASYSEFSAVWNGTSGYSTPRLDFTASYHTSGVNTNYAPVLLNPSFIGVRTGWESDDEGNKTAVLHTALQVRIQMKDYGVGSWVVTKREFSNSNYVILRGESGPGAQQDTAWNYSLNMCLTDGVYPGGARTNTTTTLDDTENVFSQTGPESFEGRVSIYVDDIETTIEPDQWHHVLVSFDLSSRAMIGQGSQHVAERSGCTAADETQPQDDVVNIDIVAVENPCKMWIALDDVDHRDVFGIGSAEYVKMGPNDLTTYKCYQAAVATYSAIQVDKSWALTGLVGINRMEGGGLPTYSYNPQKIPSNGYSFGVPCTSELLDSILAVEMAEFQMFTGVILETSIEANRRAFIDADGNPVSPVPPMIDNPDYDPNQPESADNPKQIPDPDGSPAEKLLGQKPDVLLHGSGNWIAGKNTGPMIDNPDYDPTLPESADNPKLIPDPNLQFTPTGKIVSYTPDPSLYGPQSPESPPPVRLQRRIRVPA